jgi:hypothetical protein
MSFYRVNNCINTLSVAAAAILMLLNPSYVCSGQAKSTSDAFLEACNSNDQSKRQVVDALITGLAELSGETAKQSCESYELKLKEIRSITLRGQNITDISALGSFPQVQFLDLSNNGISDISALSFMHQLISLWIPVNQVSDLSPLSSLKNIEALRASKNSIKDLTPLASLDTLISISLSYNQIEEITALSSLDSLKTIQIGHNKIVNISPLLILPELKILFANNNRISDVDATSLSTLSKRIGPDPSDPYKRRSVLINLVGNPLSEKTISSLGLLLEDNFAYQTRDAYPDKSFQENTPPEIKLLKSY